MAAELDQSDALARREHVSPSQHPVPLHAETQGADRWQGLQRKNVLFLRFRSGAIVEQILRSSYGGVILIAWLSKPTTTLTRTLDKDCRQPCSRTAPTTCVEHGIGSATLGRQLRSNSLRR